MVGMILKYPIAQMILQIAQTIMVDGLWEKIKYLDESGGHNDTIIVVTGCSVSVTKAIVVMTNSMKVLLILINQLYVVINLQTVWDAEDA